MLLISYTDERARGIFKNDYLWCINDAGKRTANKWLAIKRIPSTVYANDAKFLPPEKKRVFDFLTAQNK